MTINELSNIATSVGTYNSVPTSLTSNTSVVNLIDGITLTKDADKKNWANGTLTYTITLDNQTDTSYVKPIITDVIDTTYVKFVEDGVYINNVKASNQQYYNEGNHTLTINLEDVVASSTTTLSFCVEKNS